MIILSHNSSQTHTYIHTYNAHIHTHIHTHTRTHTHPHRPSVSLSKTLAANHRVRLRVAYLTADMHDHPTALLVLGMFSKQRANGRVEAFVFSYGPDDGSVYRRDITSE
jgi:predicted O-linked N-acetylglucosamine transferase (SPINDLY family)